MEKKRPKLQNKVEIPIKIFRGEELIAECPSIQAAARFFKKVTGASRFNWKAINNGIWFNEGYSMDGTTYFFTTDEEAVKSKFGKVELG